MMNVVFDTGSFYVWARSKTCTTTVCRKFAVSFDPSKSSTFNAAASFTFSPISYVDGTTVSGPQVEDTISIGSLRVDRYKWMLADNVTAVREVRDCM